MKIKAGIAYSVKCLTAGFRVKKWGKNEDKKNLYEDQPSPPRLPRTSYHLEMEY